MIINCFYLKHFNKLTTTDTHPDFQAVRGGYMVRSDYLDDLPLNDKYVPAEFAQFGRWVKLRNVNRKIVLLNMFRRRHLNRQNYFLTVGEFMG